MKTLPQGQEKHIQVRRMFDQIAPRYDIMNRLITLGLDRSWRRRCLGAIGLGAEDRLLDVACGTGDFSELADAIGARSIGLDYAAGMLKRAAERQDGAPFVRGDASSLPFSDGSFDAVTCGFALRNFVDIEPVLQEMARVLRSGGRLVLLEVYEPQNRFLKAIHALFFKRLVPFLGGLLSDPEAYSYLPRSVAYLPPGDELIAMVARAGFSDVKREKLFWGAAQMILGRAH